MKLPLPTNPVARTVVQMCAVVVIMLVAVPTVLIPLYNVFCDLTGLNRKFEAYQAVEAKVDESRMVRVQFLSTNNEQMPWEFRPVEFEVKVHPGEIAEIDYYARNNTKHDMVAQAIPSLMPYKAAQYFNKTECFCFNNQPLKAGEEALLKLRFVVDQDLPESVHLITMNYTLFDITPAAPESVAALSH